MKWVTKLYWQRTEMWLPALEVWERVDYKGVAWRSFFWVIGQFCILITMVVQQINTWDKFHGTNYTIPTPTPTCTQMNACKNWQSMNKVCIFINVIVQVLIFWFWSLYYGFQRCLSLGEAGYRVHGKSPWFFATSNAGVKLFQNNG